jgi:phospholipid-translocating ATPase
LYGISRRSNYFTIRRFVYYLWEGVLQAAIIYFFLQYTYVTTSTRGDGWDVYIYEMSTTMAIAAVMVANLFTGLNIFTWVGWTYFGIAFGIFLVWVYTAVFASIPPSSFVTGVYGNQVLLFRSYAFWFGVIYATLLALLPRLFIRFIMQNYLPDDIDVMRLVRKFHPEADPQTHPKLGGNFHEKTFKPTDSNETPTQGSESAPNVIPMEPIPSKVEEGENKPTSVKKGLFKTHSNATSRMGRHPSARGSAVDSESSCSLAYDSMY